MKTENGLLVMDNITIIDATPMMADVISGASPRPQEFQPSPNNTLWHKQKCWWHWAVKTHAGRKALQAIGCTVSVESPWVSSPDGWRVQPWEDRGSHNIDVGNQFGKVITRLREALGDDDAGMFFAEVCVLDYKTCNYIRSHQTMVAINVDGTRAAIAE